MEKSLVLNGSWIRQQTPAAVEGERTLGDVSIPIRERQLAAAEAAIAEPGNAPAVQFRLEQRKRREQRNCVVFRK